MPLTPKIRQRQAPRSLRGYSETETHQLIEDAAAAYEAARAELEPARGRLHVARTTRRRSGRRS